jgi:transposase
LGYYAQKLSKGLLPMSMDRLARLLFPKELKIIGQQNISDWGIKIIGEKQHIPEVCPRCATLSNRTHEYKTVTIRDEPIRGKDVILKIKKRRLWCVPCKKPFTEPIDKVAKGHRTTRNYKRGLCWAAERFHTLKDVRKNYRCSYNILYKAVYENYRKKLKERSYPWPKYLGVDEHSIKKIKYCPVEFATIFVDHKNKRVFELVEGKTVAQIEAEIAAIPGKENVLAVSIDFSTTYKSFIQKNFVNAQIVVDRFHMQRLFNRIVNKLRLRITGDDRKNPIRNLLLRNSDNLADFEKHAINKFLNMHPDLREAYQIKESIYRFFKIKGVNRAKKAFANILERLDQSKLPLLTSIRKVMVAWRTEIINFHRIRISNGRTEGFNRKAKLVQRRAYGYRNFQNYRLAFLNACK